MASNHRAENLLNASSKKWKTKTFGEKVAYVVLEFSEKYIIKGIDIGNESSAFIEVLVGNTSNTKDFTEILVTCSFMTPIESKNSTNTNRVRCFNKETLVPTAVSEKWQFVKLICTQPFNKHIQYGISFIKVHVSESEQDRVGNLAACDTSRNDSATSLNVSQLGKFKLREDSPDSESESSLFKRWKASERSDLNTVQFDASKSKAASFCVTHAKSDGVNSSLPDSSDKQKTSNDVLDRNREELAFGNEEISENEEINKKRQKLMETIEHERQQLRQRTEKTKTYHQNKKTKLNSTQTEGKTASKKCVSENISNNVRNVTEKATTATFRPFNQLLKGTTLVISGIQNPDRANLRDKALAMGSKYRPDWETGCTHLICAFKNTPKYNQVKGKGKIVTRAWIEDCYSQKKKVPWRRYALDSGDLNQPESEEEILDESLRTVQLMVANNSFKHTDLSMTSSSYNNVKSLTVSSGSDTEDEIQKVLQNKATNNGETATCAVKNNVFDATTEEEDFLTKKAKMDTTLISGVFFKGLVFFVCDDITSAERKRIEHLIQMNNGLIASEVTQAQYLITNGLLKKPITLTNGRPVKPGWIYECNDMEMEVPIKQYLL